MVFDSPFGKEEKSMKLFSQGKLGIQRKNLARRSFDDAVSFTVSRSGMCFSDSSFFSVKKVNGEYLFSAELSLKENEPHTELRRTAISAEDSDAVRNAIEAADFIRRAAEYGKKKEKVGVTVEDTEEYKTSVRFSDGQTFYSDLRPDKKITDLFAALAKKYADTDR